MTGGSVIALQMLAKEKYYSRGGQLVASFEVTYIPPPQKLVLIRGQKNENSPLKTGCAWPTFEKKAQTQI